MSLRTRLGNLGNILDEDAGQCRLLQLESPVLTTAELRAMRGYMGETSAEIDCTFDVSAGPNALKDALRRIRQETEDAVRGGATHVILSDEHVSTTRAPMPMILATGAVHTHLVRQQLRTFTSLNVRSSECMDVHYFAVLIGVGATTVNAYLSQEAIADRHRRGLFGDLTLEQCLYRFKKAIDEGLLKIMSKMGISIISSYRGGCNFEAVGLSRALVAEHFPGMVSRISGIGLAGIQKKVLEQHAHRLFRGCHRPADRRLLQVPPQRRAARLGSRSDPHASAGGGDRQLSDLQEVHGSDQQAPADPAPRPARLPLHAGARSRSTRSRASRRSASASSRRACRWAPCRRKRTARSTSP